MDEKIVQEYHDFYDIYCNKPVKEVLCEYVTVDGLEELEQGTSLYKWCDGSGKFHWRYFQLSPDYKRFVWFSHKKKLRNTQIYISNIKRIDDGLIYYSNSGGVRRDQRYFTQHLSKLAFTIYYMNNNFSNRRLTIVCKSYNELQIWKNCLKNLMFGEISRCKNIKIMIPSLSTNLGNCWNFKNDYACSRKLNKYKKLFNKLKKRSCKKYQFRKPGYNSLKEYDNNNNIDFSQLEQMLKDVKYYNEKCNYEKCKKILFFLDIELETLGVKIKRLNKNN